MKLKRLQIDYEYDFILFGIISSGKGYKLAWSINNAISIELIKIEDIDFTLKDRRRFKVVGYGYETENSKYMLMNNRFKDENNIDTGHVLPEMSRIDYLFRIDGDIYPNSAEDLLNKLRELPIVEYCLRIDVNKLKSKENLLLY